MLYSGITKTWVRDFTSKLLGVRSDSNKYFEPFPLSKAATCQTEKSFTWVDWFIFNQNIFSMNCIWSGAYPNAPLQGDDCNSQSRNLRNIGKIQQRLVTKKSTLGMQIDASTSYFKFIWQLWRQAHLLFRQFFIITWAMLQFTPHCIEAQKSSLFFWDSWKSH